MPAVERQSSGGFQSYEKARLCPVEDGSLVAYRPCNLAAPHGLTV